jgi:hypothetical protein
MAITTLNMLNDAVLGASRQRHTFSKGGLLSQNNPGTSSYWLSTSLPVAGAIPGAIESVNHLTVGALPVRQPGSGNKLYLSRIFTTAGSSGNYEFTDRLAHMGGLTGLVTTSVTVGLSLATLAGTNNTTARMGAADYSDVTWVMEWYVASSTATTTATIGYTNHLGVAKTSTISLTGVQAIGRTYVVIPQAGDFIQSIDTVTLSTAYTAGNFGFTAQRVLCEVNQQLLNDRILWDWAEIGLPIIESQACLTLTSFNNATFAPSGTIILTLAEG